jgi:hypothetical protein
LGDALRQQTLLLLLLSFLCRVTLVGDVMSHIFLSCMPALLLCSTGHACGQQREPASSLVPSPAWLIPGWTGTYTGRYLQLLEWGLYEGYYLTLKLFNSDSEREATKKQIWGFYYQVGAAGSPNNALSDLRPLSRALIGPMFLAWKLFMLGLRDPPWFILNS